MRYIIVTAALVLIAFWVFRAARGSGGAQLPKKDPRPDLSADKTGQVQDMVSCAKCGLHLPKSESVAGKLAVYCSVEHQRQAES